MAKGNYANLMHALGLFSLVVFIQKGEANTFKVGGSKGWGVPSGNSSVYNQWAESMRFQKGDSLLFVYQQGSDSVLQVSKEDYNSCNTNSPIAKYTDGNTEIKFNQSGPYYFISGNKDNCNKNEKLLVIVMADRTNKDSPPSPAAPTPAPSTDQEPPVASPPASNTTEVAPVPSAEANPPNAAASVILSLGSVAAFVGSSLLLAF